MDKYGVTCLSVQNDSLDKAADIKAYADWFNSEKLTRDKTVLSGSGAYVLETWNTGQKLSVQRKNSWWMDKLAQKPEYISAHPSKITFQIIPDNNTALLSLKDASVDVYNNIPSQDFIQLTEDPVSKKNYNFFTPETHDFTYIGLNSRSVKFADRLTRQAIRHLMDVNNIMAVTQKGFAVRTSGPFKPNDPFYNTDIQLAGYDLQKAEQLLKQAGWQKQKGQWSRVINEEKILLTIDLLYRAGNTEYESIALIFAEAARQIGIPVEVQAVEGNTLSEYLRSHNFDMFVRGISGSPGEYDFKSILHTESAALDGNNYTGFGTAESDSLIDLINHSVDDKAKAVYLKRFQQILYEEATIIFLYTLKNRIAINKRLSNVKLLASKYGYDVSALTFTAP
jgi:peptide/nickel transport system substrate-binding protein